MRNYEQGVVLNDVGQGREYIRGTLRSWNHTLRLPNVMSTIIHFKYELGNKAADIHGETVYME